MNEKQNQDQTEAKPDERSEELLPAVSGCRSFGSINFGEPLDKPLFCPQGDLIKARCKYLNMTENEADEYKIKKDKRWNDGHNCLKFTELKHGRLVNIRLFHYNKNYEIYRCEQCDEP